ncbi:MAG: RDD family protein [Bryobacteraceae bacterium]
MSAEASPKPGQQALFHPSGPDPRVISFDSLTTQAEREAIRARAADLSRPAPLKTEKVEVRHARTRKTRSADQRRLDFFGEEAVLAPPRSSIVCDALVAPPGLRMKAALVDALLITLACSFGVVIFKYLGGQISLDKHTVPWLAAALLTVPLFYKFLWTFVAHDTVGMRCAGLRLVDFDGNPPSHARRYQRLFGALISFLAAGIGLIWALVDEDALTWHDHISSTFPTLASED